MAGRRWRYMDAYHAGAGGYEVIEADDTDEAREEARVMVAAEAAEEVQALWDEWEQEAVESLTEENERKGGSSLSPATPRGRN